MSSGRPHDYCTIFDSHYLARALALYRSLERSDPNFVLRAVCMDSTASELLRRLPLPNLRIIPIEEIEAADSGLRAARSGRTSWEYCWTATPAVCLYFLHNEPELELLTYLDADLFVWSSPAPLFDELGQESILLIRHRTSREREQTVGVYNVGWISFRNDDRGREAVGWWRERCLEWCYDRIEPGRFGDQKYLDDWPTRFEGVRVSSLAAAGLGPENEARHEVTPPADGGPPLVDGAPLIYFHHSGIHAQRATRTASVVARWTGDLELFEQPVRVIYTLSSQASVPAVLDLVWRPYMACLTQALGELSAAHAPLEVCVSAPSGPLMLWHVLKRRAPTAVAAYRRLPVILRHRIQRSLTRP
jgi:hypothetical protein